MASGLEGIKTEFSSSQLAETAFEKRRGVSGVEVRTGFTQVHILNLAEPLAESRISALRQVAEGGVSLDFLKLTPNGMSFIVSESVAGTLERALKSASFDYQIARERAIVMVSAVNMRDEEGLIARILGAAISAGVSIDHVTDMHDRMLVVTTQDSAQKLSQLLEREFCNG